MSVWQTCWQLRRRLDVGPRGKDVQADLKDLATRLETSKAPNQYRIAPDQPYLYLWTMAIVEAVD
jgi:hypothetical protein